MLNSLLACEKPAMYIKACRHMHTHILAWFTWVVPVSAALGYGFSLLSTVLLTIL